MRKREFQRAAVFAIIPVIIECTKEEGKRLTLSVTSKFYDTFINLRFSGGMLQINLYQKGEITYKVWDCIGICGEEYVKYYVCLIINVTEDIILSAAEIHSVSWKQSHESICNKEFLEMHSVEHQRKYLLDEIQKGKNLYMMVEDRPLGIVSVCGNLIENLYVLPGKQGKGYGTQLLLYAVEQCIGIPTLWILESNARAYAMYQKHGFRKTGKFNKLTDALSEIELSRVGQTDTKEECVDTKMPT
ncbi:MAG: GNAT family N-acetyltransferase [Velocimicrobium sp.]